MGAFLDLEYNDESFRMSHGSFFQRESSRMPWNALRLPVTVVDEGPCRRLTHPVAFEEEEKIR